MHDHTHHLLKPEDVDTTPTVATIGSVAVYPGFRHPIEIEVRLVDLGRKKLTKTDLKNLSMSLGTEDPTEFKGRKIKIKRETADFEDGPKTYVRVLPDRVRDTEVDSQ